MKAANAKNIYSIKSHYKKLQQYTLFPVPSALNTRKYIIITILFIVLVPIILAIALPEVMAGIFITIITSIALVKVVVILYSYTLPCQNEDNALHQLLNITRFPLYTIVVPLFMESKYNILCARKNILSTLYPNIEVIYIIESIDHVAHKTFKEINLHSFEKCITIPRIPPFTKPKACNYALEFARGKYITVYDIEDIPHQRQLHMASYMFAKDKNLCCVQFPLEFYSCNIIHTIWQKIDYIVWFNGIIKVLSKVNAPIPLGGTSNHFITKELRMLAGWDAYNVTEDAELGIRMAALGYKTQYCEIFATLEKPLLNLMSLFNQRVRWAKGHLITAIQVTPYLFTKHSFCPALLTLFIVLSQWVAFPICLMLFAMSLFCNVSSGNQFIMALICINVVLFIAMPLIYVLFIKKCRNQKVILGLITYSVFHIFYFAVLIKAMWQAVKMPYKWYKSIK